MSNESKKNQQRPQRPPLAGIAMEETFFSMGSAGAPFQSRMNVR